MNTAHDLFLLMFNLTQVHDREKLIEMFLDGLHEIFEPAGFQFTKENIEETRFDIEIKTRRSHFGFIRITEFKNEPKEYLPLIQNATQMLAVMLERLYFDRQLQEEKNSLEQIAEERNKDLQKKIKELEQAKNTSLNLVEDLQEEIQKRTRYEKELKESEERFRSIYENSSVGLTQVSFDFKIISANEAYCKMLGYDEDELAGKYLKDITHPDVLEENLQKQKLLAAGKIDHYRMEKRFIHKNGKTVIGILDANLIRDANGKGIYFLGSVVDITERKRDQEKLKYSEEKFRTLFRDHSAVKLIIDPDSGNIVEANQAAAVFYGWSVEELEQKSIFQINTLPPDKINAEMSRALDNSKTIFKFKHRKADGSVCDVEVYGSRVKIDGKAYIYSIVHDISEKKKIEEKLKLISRSVEQNPVSIVITDANGIIEYTNPAFTRVTGYSFEEVKGENPHILQSGYHSKAFYKELWDTILNGQDWQGEFHNKRKNGELYWEQAVISPIVDQEGKITHFVGVKEDVTEKKRTFEDLKRAKEKAEESDRLKTAFLANMSHEIRTPMNGILGFTNLLKEPDLTSEENNEYIEIIHRSGQRMMNTVNDLVEMSKIEAGIVTTDRQETNLNHYLDDVIQFFRPEAQRKGLELKLEHILPEDQSTIITDAHKFEEILTNLVKNAIKYTDEGRIKVGANIKNDWVEFYVKDTGIGVPKHRQEAIFNRFEQADIKDTRAFEGSGLGLAISKSYIGMLGGEIWLESEENKGSVFYFTLPVKKAKESKPAENSNEPTESSDQKSIETPDKKLKVLVAEDDYESFIYLTTILKKYNWDLIHTVTGRQTIEKYREQPDIDLILMDIKLPDIDGHEATRRIKEINPDVPIIAQTAYALEGDREKAIEAGCDEYISKPMSKQTLLNLVNKVVGKKKML